MTSENQNPARNAIFGRLKETLQSGRDQAAAESAVAQRLSDPPQGPLPARGQLPPNERLELFVSMAEEHEATVARISSLEEVPEALSEYLRQHNLPQEIAMAEGSELATLPWDRAASLELRQGRPSADDSTTLAPAFAAVAESGTLMLLSGASRATGHNFLPDNHIVVLRAADVVGALEQAWSKLRAAGLHEPLLPRTVNFITGPSRTADIEQTIQMGAHGPRRLHILVVGEAGPA
jgi:L-lactate dehydrogenase complex protein LldG